MIDKVIHKLSGCLNLVKLCFMYHWHFLKTLPTYKDCDWKMVDFSRDCLMEVCCLKHICCSYIQCVSYIYSYFTWALHIICDLHSATDCVIILQNHTLSCLKYEPVTELWASQFISESLSSKGQLFSGDVSDCTGPLEASVVLLHVNVR